MIHSLATLVCCILTNVFNGPQRVETHHTLLLRIEIQLESYKFKFKLHSHLLAFAPSRGSSLQPEGLMMIIKKTHAHRTYTQKKNSQRKRNYTKRFSLYRCVSQFPLANFYDDFCWILWAFTFFIFMTFFIYVCGHVGMWVFKIILFGSFAFLRLFFHTIFLSISYHLAVFPTKDSCRCCCCCREK